MPSLKSSFRLTAVAVVCGAAVGLLMSYVGAQHNAQGEYSDANGHLNSRLLLPVFLSWFFLIFAIVIAVGVGWRVVRDRLERS